MTIERLRPAHDAATLKEIYREPHDHRRFGRGHGERVQTMIEMVAGHLWGSAADLSCGNGVVLDSVMTSGPKFYGDFAPGYQFTGPIEDTITDLPEVDLFILGETLEHLDDPPRVLRSIVRRADWLLLSTPIEAWGDTNGEHYWAWDQQGVEELVGRASPDPVVFTDFRRVDTRLYGEPYCYGIWLVRL